MPNSQDDHDITPKRPSADNFPERSDSSGENNSTVKPPDINHILDELPVAVLTFNQDLTCTSSNSVGEDQYNHTGMPLRGQPVVQFFPLDEFPFLQASLRKVLGSGIPEDFVETYARKSSPPKWHSVTIKPKGEGLLFIGVDITDRKQAEHEIIKNEERLQSIFESTFISLAVIDDQGKFTLVNQHFLQMLGYQHPRELVGQKAIELVAPVDFYRAADLFQFDPERYENQETSQVLRLVTNHGQQIEVAIAAKLVHLPNQEQTEIILLAEDITEQQRSEKINAAIYTIAEASGQTTSLNELYTRIHETIKEIMPANNFYIAIYDANSNIISFPYFVDEHDSIPSPMDADQIEKSISMYILRRGESLLCTKEVSDELSTRGDLVLYGAFPAIWLGVPLIIGGRTIGVMAVQHYTDPDAYKEREKRVLEFVSSEVAKAIQKKQAESALIESEKRFRSVVQFSPIGIHLFRLLPNGQLILIDSNTAAENILKVSLNQQTGAAFEQLFPRLTALGLLDILKEIAQMGGVYRKEVIIHFPDGEIEKALDYTAFQPSTNEVAVHFQDVTDRVRYEKEIRSLNEDLEQRVFQRTVELEASTREMEAFAYSVSHDLRAPVRAIKGFAEILKLDEGNLEKRELISRIVASGDRMNHLINDLLSLSHLGQQNLTAQQINLSAIAESIIEEEVETNSGREYIIDIQETPLAVADRDMVRILLTNLINNAVKFSASKEPSKITFGYREDVNPGAYFVKDNGIGFDMKYAEKVFSPFERLHAAEFEGTGIGLAIVYRVIRRHEGKIWVETQPGKGATFYFTLDHPQTE
jgi:PAS domain S-box-containing protein